jgi:hypothetical protein
MGVGSVTGSPAFGLYAEWYDLNGSNIGHLHIGDTTLVNGIEVISGQATAPSSTAYIKWLVDISGSGTTTGFFGAPILRRMYTGSLIVDGTITGTNIAAETITAANIEAATITGSLIAANTVTAANIILSATSGAITQDPQLLDSTAWSVVGGSGGIAGNGATFSLPAGNNYLGNSTGAAIEIFSAKAVPIDSGKTYRISCLYTQIAGTAQSSGFYMVVDLLDSSGSIISGDGSYWFYPVDNGATSSAVTYASALFGANTGHTLPSNAVFVRVGFLANLSAVAGVGIAVQNLRIDEAVDASLIVEGTITATQIAAGTITGTNIAAGTITATNLAADSVVAGAIAAGAINATSIIVDNIIVTGHLVDNAVTGIGLDSTGSVSLTNEVFTTVGSASFTVSVQTPVLFGVVGSFTSSGSAAWPVLFQVQVKRNSDGSIVGTYSVNGSLGDSGDWLVEFTEYNLSAGTYGYTAKAYFFSIDTDDGVTLEGAVTNNFCDFRFNYWKK